MKRIPLGLIAFLIPLGLFGQASGVGQIWTSPSATLQSAATANGNGTAFAVSGLSAIMVTVNCSVTCSGGTTITFQVSQDGTNYVAVNGEQVGTSTVATTVVNQSTTPTIWRVNVAGAADFRAPISAYSAGTITVTAQAVAGSDGHDAIINTAQNGGPWSFNLLQLASTTLGAPSNYGTSPGAVAVPGVNAFVTNTPSVTGSGTAGTPAPGVVSVQGITSMTPVQTNQTQIAGSTLVASPCMVNTISSVNISLTASTQLITGTSGKQTYICGGTIFSQTAETAALVEGTGTTCGTSTAGMSGGTTAGTGWGFGATSPWAIQIPNTGGFAYKTATAADNVCLLVSGSGQVSGNLLYVQQ